MTTSEPAPSSRSRVRRKADRGRYDWATIASILDSGIVCHVGLNLESEPIVIPMAYGRIDCRLYLHGASGNATLRSLSAGAEACITVTLVDGLVLSRSAFHHSVNYRSVMCFGRGEGVGEEAEKRAGLTSIVEHMVPGRSSDTRPPSAEELRSTMVVRFNLGESSAKVRTGGPIEEPADLSLDYWAGQVPLRLATGAPVVDRPGTPATPVPSYLSDWAERRDQGVVSP